jgi:hypothetical protein
VGAELVIQVPHVRPDRVDRHVELAGDLRSGKAGLQEAQDPGFGLAERLGQLLRRARRRRTAASGPAAGAADAVPPSMLMIFRISAGCAVRFLACRRSSFRRT